MATRRPGGLSAPPSVSGGRAGRGGEGRGAARDAEAKRGGGLFISSRRELTVNGTESQPPPRELGRDRAGGGRGARLAGGPPVGQAGRRGCRPPRRAVQTRCIQLHDGQSKTARDPWLRERRGRGREPGGEPHVSQGAVTWPRAPGPRRPVRVDTCGGSGLPKTQKGRRSVLHHTCPPRRGSQWDQIGRAHV